MKVISPADVAPRSGAGAGNRAHRRVVARDAGGPPSIDVGYNTFGRGVSAPAYAYNKDEFCYTAAGAMRSETYGVTSVTRAGYFMWRPARAPTHAVTFESDSVTICAFGPARIDDWSHRLPPEEIGKWEGDPAARPLPIRVHYADVAPTPFPPAPEQSGILYREIFSERKSGSKQMDVSHLTFQETVRLGQLPTTRDEIWWLECGGVRGRSNGRAFDMKPTEFLSRGPGETLTDVDVEEGSVIVWFSAPPMKA